MKKLVLELNDKLNIVKKHPTEVKETVFIKSDDKQVAMMDLKEMISPKERAQVVALASFLMENENLSQEELDQVLKGRFFKFAFLRRINKRVPDLIDELKTRGVIYVLGRYQESIIMDQLAK